MNEKEIDKLVEEKVIKMIKERPTDMIMFMLVQMGKMVIETNAGSLELKQESTLDGQRYEIKAKITVKKIKG